MDEHNAGEMELRRQVQDCVCVITTRRRLDAALLDALTAPGVAVTEVSAITTLAQSGQLEQAEAALQRLAAGPESETA